MEKTVNFRRMRQLKHKNLFDSHRAFDEIESNIVRNNLYRHIWLALIGSTGWPPAKPGYAVAIPGWAVAKPGWAAATPGWAAATSAWPVELGLAVAKPGRVAAKPGWLWLSRQGVLNQVGLLLKPGWPDRPEGLVCD
jgi:hypothetical protein